MSCVLRLRFLVEFLMRVDDVLIMVNGSLKCQDFDNKGGKKRKDDKSIRKKKRKPLRSLLT